MIKSFFEKEAHEFVFKVSLGLVCLSVLIFSLFQLGYTFQTWALQFNDGFRIISLVYTATLLLSLLGLLAIFRKKRQKLELEIQDPERPFVGMSLQEKGFIFMRGLLDGLMHGRG